MYQSHHLINKLKILDQLSLYEESDALVFKRKPDVLKEVALALVEELESLESVCSVNLRRGIILPDEMRRFEVHLIQSALERTGGHQTKAARLLGINLTTLHNKLKRLDISQNIRVDAPVLHEDKQGARAKAEVLS